MVYKSFYIRAKYYGFRYAINNIDVLSNYNGRINSNLDSYTIPSKQLATFDDFVKHLKQILYKV